MAKKNNVQVTTVRKFANVQVIELNAAFVARVMKTQIILENAAEFYSPMNDHVDEAFDEATNLINDLVEAFLGEEEEKSPKCKPAL